MGEIPLAFWITIVTQMIVFVMFLARLDARLDNQEKRMEVVVQHLLKKP